VRFRGGNLHKECVEPLLQIFMRKEYRLKLQALLKDLLGMGHHVFCKAYPVSIVHVFVRHLDTVVAVGILGNVIARKTLCLLIAVADWMSLEITSSLKRALGELYYKEGCDQKGWAYISLDNIKFKDDR